ncbi:MAG: methyl-accepting chemotaxis protein [Desulfobacterium sp.]
MKKKSLKFKLISGGLLAVVIPLLVVGLFSINKSSEAFIAIAKGQVSQVSQNLAVMTDMFLEQEVKLASEIAIEPLMVDAATKIMEEGLDNAGNELTALDRFFVTIFQQIGSGYDLLFVTDLKGTIFSDSTGGTYRTKKLSVADRDYFKSAINGSVSIGMPILSKVSGKPVIVVAVPVKNDSGEIAAIFGAAVKLDGLSDKITQVKIGKTGYPFMMDKAGNMLAHPDKKLILNLNLTEAKGMESITRQMLAQKSGVEEYTFKGVDKIAGFAPVKMTGWGVAVTQNQGEFLAPVYAIRNMVLIAGGIFLLLTLVAVLFFSRSITLPINRIIHGLGEGSTQVAAASTQVSSSSQSLAEGASEQAASIEETSASMEEMSSMTKKTAENAKHADTLTRETNLVVNEANASMGLLTDSMKDISKASEETSKIIKTIDEIAFQTNLLALNAAVEAARAGEAGAGFAVVADEVRNLAMRAADAAKNTAQMIEGTVKKVNEGSELVSKTHASFEKVSVSSGKVEALVAEIAEASNEQARGIEQVNIAISEMDKVVQQNAANAEESASASEEMNAQAGQLKEYVRDLVILITGSNESYQAEGDIPPRKRTRIPSHNRPSPARNTKQLSSKTKEITPEQMIPFDDDFENF